MNPHHLLRHTWRHFVSGPQLTIVIATLSLVCVLAVTLTPTLLARAATDSLQYDLHTAIQKTSLDFSGRWPGGFRSGPAAPAQSQATPTNEVWGSLDQSLSAIRYTQPTELRSCLGAPQEAVIFDAAPVQSDASGAPFRASQLSLALSPSFSTAVNVTETAPISGAPGPTTDDATPITLSENVAEEMGWTVGTARLLALPAGGELTVVLTKTFSPVRADESIWAHVPDALNPDLIPTSDGGTIARGVAFVDASLWPQLSGTAIPMQTAVWFPVIADSFQAPDSAVVLQQARAFISSTFQVAGQTSGPSVVQQLTVNSILPDVLESSNRDQRDADALIWMSLSGPGVLVLIVLAEICALLSYLRLPGYELLAARGSSPAIRRAMVVAETGSASVAGAGCGLAVTFTILAAAHFDFFVPVWALTASVCLVLFMAGCSLRAGCPKRPEHKRLSLLRRAGPVVSLLLVAAASLLVLIENGSSSPLRAFAPVLVVSSATVAVSYLLPPMMRRIVSAGRRGRGTARLFGVRGHHRALFIGSVLALAIALFSDTLLNTVRSAVVEASVSTVGADISVRGSSLTKEIVDEIARTPGVMATAAVLEDKPVTVSVGSARLQERLLVVNTNDLSRVQAGNPSALTVPAGFDRPGPGDTVPVVASATATIGLKTSGRLQGQDLEVTGTAPDDTPLTAAKSWILVDAANAGQLTSATGTANLILVRLDQTRNLTDLTASIGKITGANAQIDSAIGSSTQQLASPRIATQQVVLTSAAGTGVFLAVVLLAVSVEASRRKRNSTLRILRALGMNARDCTRLLLWEFTPTVLASTVSSALIGIVLSYLLIPLLDLGQVASSAVTVRVRLPAELLTLVVGSYLAVSLVVVVVTALVHPLKVAAPLGRKA